MCLPCERGCCQIIAQRNTMNILKKLCVLQFVSSCLCPVGGTMGTCCGTHLFLRQQVEKQ
uniref:Uncharacterized protein n=1 Tax=Anguilla anguilla TaxID=7936 RepID=A0A0E9WKT7_ANGAN